MGGGGRVQRVLSQAAPSSNIACIYYINLAAWKETNSELPWVIRTGPEADLGHKALGITKPIELNNKVKWEVFWKICTAGAEIKDQIVCNWSELTQLRNELSLKPQLKAAHLLQIPYSGWKMGDNRLWSCWSVWDRDQMHVKIFITSSNVTNIACELTLYVILNVHSALITTKLQ